jgi:hypothetical protein
MLAGIILILSSLSISSPTAHAQEQGTPPPRMLDAVTVMPDSDTPSPSQYYSVSTLSLSNGELIDQHHINGPSAPPPGFELERQPVGLPKTGDTAEPSIGEPDAPAYVLGCSSTAAVDIVVPQDRGENYPTLLSALSDSGLYSFKGLGPVAYLPNLYTGPTNGGVMPWDNSAWPTWTDACGGTYSNNPVVASHQGVDGRTTLGTIDNYWVCYESEAADPYITQGRQPHPPETLGDYMLTSQSARGNKDGLTTFSIYTNSARPFTCDKAAIENLPDGSLGRKLFYESRGYAVAECYNQYTDNVVAGGFSLAQFKAEIDAGRPVMLGLQGHNVVGIGYDTSSNQIYIHDGWDYNTHTMTWGGSYAGFSMLMVSIVNPIPPAHHGDYTISGYAGVPNATITYTGGSTKASISGYYSFSVSPGWSGRVTPSKPGYTFAPPFRDYTNVTAYQTKQNYTAAAIPGSNLIQDPSFEAGIPNPYWEESSTNFGTPLCDASCGDGARTGSVWGWFGGIASNETATLTQPVTIPSGSSASLDFYLLIDEPGAGSNAADVFTVKVDGTTLFSANATQFNSYSAYTPVSVNVSAYANGAPHVITFSSVTTGQVVSFHLDDVSLASTPIPSLYTISGNVGVANATITYTGGSTMADGSGNYSFSVLSGWIGTVTPSHACYTFIPTSRTYNNVTANQTAQDYTPTIKPGAGCAEVDVIIGGTNRGNYGIPPGGQQRVEYALDSGPVKVVSTNGVPIIAALRDSWKDSTTSTWTSFVQMMGLPKEQLSDTYYFPSYNNRSLSGQLRFGNVDTVGTWVRVVIGGVQRGRYYLDPSEQQRVEYALDSGPVVVESETAGVKIIAALRDAWWDGTRWTSFSQMMGLPKEQLSDSYYFPSYNNVSLSGQLRFGNVDTVGTWVRVVIGGVQRGRYYLDPSEQQRVEYALDSGPVVIESETAGVKIIAALRDSWYDGKTWTSFVQMMGLPKESLSDTYYLPTYNNISLSGQLRFGNVDTVGTWVRVVIGGVQRGRYFLDPSEQVRVEYNLDSGPVVIESETAGVQIIAALRDAWYDGARWTSFAQLMGLTALSDTYYFPSYNNVSLSGQLRFGVP